MQVRALVPGRSEGRRPPRYNAGGASAGRPGGFRYPALHLRLSPSPRPAGHHRAGHRLRLTRPFVARALASSTILRAASTSNAGASAAWRRAVDSALLPRDRYGAGSRSAAGEISTDRPDRDGSPRPRSRARRLTALSPAHRREDRPTPRQKAHRGALPVSGCNRTVAGLRPLRNASSYREATCWGWSLHRRPPLPRRRRCPVGSAPW